MELIVLSTQSIGKFSACWTRADYVAQEIQAWDNARIFSEFDFIFSFIDSP